ncbi:MAG: hypothetical protein PVI91_08175 [Gammaproteobacteria bacterium]|jgi:hypothetical protein
MAHPFQGSAYETFRTKKLELMDPASRDTDQQQCDGVRQSSVSQGGSEERAQQQCADNKDKDGNATLVHDSPFQNTMEMLKTMA